jgi:hypothetical protein
MASPVKSHRREEVIQQPQQNPLPPDFGKEAPITGSHQQPSQFAESTIYTHSEVKTPLITPPAPSIQVVPNLAQDLIGESHAASSAKITSTTQQPIIADAAGYLSEEALRDEKRKREELAKIAAKSTEQLERQTEKYRKEAEEKAEKIRKELEQQHVKDIEFRKGLVEQAIETQKRQIDVEEKFAKMELEREKKLAESALDQSKLSTVTEVSLDTAAGTATSSGTVVSEKVELKQEEEEKEPKSLGAKIKDWLLG